MAQKNRTTLKGYFEVGDIPNQNQYADLIDSFVTLNDNNSGSIHLTGSINLVGINGNITASQNISASGDIYANSFGPNVNTLGIISSSAATGTSSFGTEIVLDNHIYLQGRDLGGTARNLISLTNGNAFSVADSSYNTYIYGGNIIADSSGDITLDSATGNISASNNGTTTVWIDTTSGHITASGDISASGTIYANDFKSSGGDTSGVTFHDNLNITGSITASGGISSSGTVEASAFNLNGTPLGSSTDTYWNNNSFAIYYSGGNVGIGTVNPNAALEVFGDISASKASTGSFGKVECDVIYATTGQFAANTIFIGTETFNEANLTDLKEGKSIRNIDNLENKSYELGDGRKISRKFEQRFNRWAPNLEFEEREGADAVQYEEIDRIPQTYVDFTDKEYRVKMFGGRSQYKQGLFNIEIKSDYNSVNSAIDICSPTTTFCSQHNDKQAHVIVSGSLTVTGSSTLTNWGKFKNRFHNKNHHFTVTTNPYAYGGFRDHLTHSITNSPTSSAPHLHFQLSGSGQAGIGTLAPKHTLHVSASSGDFNALQVEGDAIINGFLGANAVGNPSTLTGNTVVPAGYNVVLWTTNANPSITIPGGSSYTVSAGSNVKMVNMDNL